MSVASYRNGEKGDGHQRSRIDGALVMEASRRYRSIELSVYERNEKDERTLLPYEELGVDWERVEASCREVITLLNRANRRVRPTSEILSSLKKSGRILFELLIPPKAREKLNSAPTRNLILYVDDKLVQIPWELLFNGEEFLCRRFGMGRIVSTRQAPASLSTRTLKTPFKLLVLGDPRGDLEASYREGIEIRNFLDASREIFHVDFKSQPVEIGFVKKNLRDYDIVHYAGHADYLTDNPSESGWLLSDGRLKASEISAMGGRQPMPSLVFCNACQTAQTGEWAIEEGYEQCIFGLANAYLLSGVRHYIGTFWEIVDEQSSHFAKRFYDFLARGENIGEAIRKTRQEYSEETLIWASYVLYGDPTFRLLSAWTEAASNPSGRKTNAHRRRVPGSGYLYVASGGLLSALIFAAYSFFYPKAPLEKISSPPMASVAVAQIPSPTPEKEIEKPPQIKRTTEVKIRKDAEKFRAVEVPAKVPPQPHVAESITPPSLPDPATIVPIVAEAPKYEIGKDTEEFRPIEQPAKTPPPDIKVKVVPSPSFLEPATILPVVAEAPKYKVGDSWTLRLFYGQTVTRRIRAIESGLYVLECDSNRWQYLDRELVLRREATPEGKDRYPELLNQKFLDFPLSLDKNWEFKILTVKSQRDGAKSFPAYWRVFRYRVAGNETIKTPAGSFGAFNIVERSNEIACDSRCEDVPNTAVIRQLWYAPEARFIVKVAHVRGEPWHGEEADYELISLNLK
jgi:CHAT domain-containing protein